MTLTRKTLCDALCTVCERLTGVSADPDHRSEASGLWDHGTQASITVRLRRVAGIGRDERRRDYDPLAVIEGDTYPGSLGGIVEELTGNRKCFFEVHVECGDQDVGAPDFAEKIKVGLRLPTSRATLRAAGLAVNSIGDVVDFPTEAFANREISFAVLEVICNAADAVSDDPVTTIETVDRTLALG